MRSSAHWPQRWTAARRFTARCVMPLRLARWLARPMARRVRFRLSTTSRSRHTRLQSSDLSLGKLVPLVNFGLRHRRAMPMLKRLMLATLCSMLLGASPPALATDYSDIWWIPAESGWGINFDQNEDVIFAPFYF